MWLRIFVPLRPLPGGPPLGRGSDGRFGLRRFRAKLTPTPFGTNRAFPHALPPSLRPPFGPFARVVLFFLAAAQVKEKQADTAEGKKHEIRRSQPQNQRGRRLSGAVAGVRAERSAHAVSRSDGQISQLQLRQHHADCEAEPDATNVAGYRTWTTLGRFVKRGEKGIFILAPMVGNKRTKNEVKTRMRNNLRMPRRLSPRCTVSGACMSSTSLRPKAKNFPRSPKCRAT